VPPRKFLSGVGDFFIAECGVPALTVSRYGSL
jgi:hypothetical protein